MICYQCNSEIGTSKKCPNCGADLEVIQRVRRISNSLYNDAYYKTQVRDLSGAISSLESCLKYNKYNTEARNLLGLVYYEIGETVNALSEWVVSVNLQPENNRASRYLKMLQETKGLMEQMNQTTKKYNQAVYYCSEGNNDLAIIQLKKVIELNPNMLKAHQLLGLLYLKQNQLEKARKELRIAGKIDSANTLTFRYMKEVNRMVRMQTGKPEVTEEELLIYQNGNDSVIMPKRFRENSLGTMIRYMIVGVMIGAVATSFVITPAVMSQVRSQMQERVLEISDAVSYDKQEVSALENQIEGMQEDIDNATEIQALMNNTTLAYESLLAAETAWREEDKETASEMLCQVDETLLTEESRKIYRSIREDLGEEYLDILRALADKAFSEKEYERAILFLAKVISEEPDHDQGNSSYVLAMAYRKSGDMESADIYFQYVINMHPNTNLARLAQNMLTGKGGVDDDLFGDDGILSTDIPEEEPSADIDAEDGGIDGIDDQTGAEGLPDDNAANEDGAENQGNAYGDD